VLELEPCPDILASVGSRVGRPFCVGFAAETDELEAHARAKLHAKGADLIAANWVGPAAAETAGAFGADVNALRLFWQDGGLELPVTTKEKLARQLVAVIAERYHRPRPAGRHHNVVTLKS